LFEENPELNALFPKFYGLETTTARTNSEIFQADFSKTLQVEQKGN
jgi:hypothetical protein